MIPFSWSTKVFFSLGIDHMAPLLREFSRYSSVVPVFEGMSTENWMWGSGQGSKHPWRGLNRLLWCLSPGGAFPRRQCFYALLIIVVWIWGRLPKGAEVSSSLLVRQSLTNACHTVWNLSLASCITSYQQTSVHPAHVVLPVDTRSSSEFCISGDPLHER